MTNVFFAYPLQPALRDRVRRELGDAVTFGMLPAAGSRPEDLTAWAGARVLVADGADITVDALDAMPALSWAHSVSSGVESVPLERLRARSILLSNSRGIHAKTVAEQVLGHMIMFSRGLHVYRENQQTHRWDRNYAVDELEGRCLVIVGAGAIGLEVARKAKAFDMEVIGIKTRPAPLPSFDEVVAVDQIDDVIPRGDYVLVVTPLTADTVSLIDRRRLHRMKSSAVLLNYARGSVVDESAMIHALQDGVIRGAALDVCETEPLPATHPLWGMDQVLLTPHIGGWTPHHGTRLVNLFLDNWRRYVRGHPLLTPVNLSRGY